MRRRQTAATLLAAALGAAAPSPPESLDDLYARLAAATSRAEAASVEGRIVTLAGQSVSPTVGILLDQAHAEEARDQPERAVADAGSAIDLQPELGALWRERGIARLRAGDNGGAAADLGHAIDLEPRDFLAWISLSVALEHAGNTDGAIAAWKRVLLLDPHVENSRSRLQTLKRQSEGEHA